MMQSSGSSKMVKSHAIAIVLNAVIKGKALEYLVVDSNKLICVSLMPKVVLALIKYFLP